MNFNTCQDLRDLINSAGSSFVGVTYIKKDGTERKAIFNPKHKESATILGTGSELKPDAKNRIFRYIDERLYRQHLKELAKDKNKQRDCNQYRRSFDLSRVARIRVNKKEYIFSPRRSVINL